MRAGPGGLLGAAEGLSYLSLAAGAVVLVLQVRHIIGSLPNSLARQEASPLTRTHFVVISHPVVVVCVGTAKHCLHKSPKLFAGAALQQVKNYGYVPSALPDAKCFGDSGPKSPSDITKALADAFASTSRDAPPLTNSVQDAGISGRPAASRVADSAAFSSGAAASQAGPQVLPQPPSAVPHQGVDALFDMLDS